jgi:hypothetical protein
MSYTRKASLNIGGAKSWQPPLTTEAYVVFRMNPFGVYPEIEERPPIYIF